MQTTFSLKYLKKNPKASLNKQDSIGFFLAKTCHALLLKLLFVVACHPIMFVYNKNTENY